MNADETVTAVFVRVHQLTVQSTPPKGLSIGSSTGHDGETDYVKTEIVQGASVNLQAPATDPAGYRFVRWSLLDAPSPSGADLWTTGRNVEGQLGLGDNTDRNAFTQAPAMADVVAAAGGNMFSLALRSDGAVWATGLNDSGQLGLGDSVDRNEFALVPTLGDVTAVSCAYGGYSLALRADGTVWGTGYNPYGQLGLGDEVNRDEFTQVPGLTDVIAISAGGSHSLALKNDGAVWAVGHNGRGQLGLGDNTHRNVFTSVPGLTNVIAISAGGGHSLLLKNDGTVWAAGQNAFGELGLGDNADRNVFTTVPGLNNMVAVSAGCTWSFALMNGGTVMATGDNFYGQLGLGDNTDRNEFAPIPGLADVADIASGYHHSLALMSDGTAWATGLNRMGWVWEGGGQLGLGDNTDRNAFTHVSNLANVISLGAGSYHSLAIAGDPPPPPEEKSITFTMDADTTATAVYVKQWTLTIDVSPCDGGTTVPAAGPHTYDDGAVVNLSASAHPGYRFDRWEGDVADPNAAATTIAMNANETVTAMFSPLPVLGISVTPAEFHFGILHPGAPATTAGSALVVQNTGNVAEDVGLRIRVQDDRNEWTVGTPAENVYDLSTRLADAIGTFVASDALTTITQWCDGANFGGGGSAMAAGTTVNQWFEFKAPTSVTGAHALSEHAVTVELTCRQAE